MRGFILLLLLICYQTTAAQSDKGTISTRDLIECINDLTDFVAIPNSGLDKNNIDRNISWLATEFTDRAFKVERWPTSGNPLFFAELIVDKKLPTLLFYMHLDGQPVDPTKWDQPDPYRIVVKTRDEADHWQVVSNISEQTLDLDWRLFGRSAADDKAPIVAFLHAIDALAGMEVKTNLKVIIDAEEEIGSKSLAAAVRVHRDQLKADLLIINDGPVHISGEPTLIFGCRGIMRVDLTTYGPVLPQHSGHYGNYAPNPVFSLAELLASMKDDEGRVVIDGYYDGINLDNDIKQKLALVPDDENTIADLLQIAKPEKVGSNYQESLQFPSLNIRGIASGWVGAQARTIVPDKASVAIDIRLVPESNPQDLVTKIRKHIQAEGYHIVDHEPTKAERRKHAKIIFMHNGPATLPFRTNMESRESNWLASVLEEAFGRDPIKIRIMGGTVPITDMIQELSIPAVIVPMVNADNNQHSPNENMRIGHLMNAIKIFLSIFRADTF